ncbi:hypothetical protein ACFX2A_048213 [Malus domestica]
MATNRKSNEDDEPNGAPETDRWYSLTLGSSFVDHRPSPKFCTLRYEFKPASIDKNQPGLLHKSKDNRVALEFHNNQHGKPKVTFEGVSEDHKKDEAVLFFDGEGFRLERLHRAVKRLRHVRLPGESTAPVAAVMSTSVSAVESYSPPTGGKGPKLQSLYKDILPNMPPVEMKEIDNNSSACLDPGPKPETGENFDCPPSLPNPPTASPDAQRSDEMEEEVDVVIDDDDNEDDGDNDDDISEKGRSPGKEFHTGIDINLPHPGVMDDEIADADVSDDVMYNGPNAAKALRGQVNAEVGEKHTDMDDEVVDVSDDMMDNGPNAAEALKAQVNAEVGEKQTYLDDEIVDVSDDVMDNGPNAAEALRAQVNAEVGEKETSSSNDTSESESSSGSGSGSGSESESESESSSSDNESSEGGDSVNSI